MLELAEIEADIIDGSRRDALLYSLSANSAHGLQRSPSDYSRAYNTACRNGLVDSADIEAVAALLRCSGSWATKLTWKAREAAKVARDAGHGAGRPIGGKTKQEQIKDFGRYVGCGVYVAHGFVQRQHSAEIAQERPHPDPAPFLSEAAKMAAMERAAKRQQQAKGKR